MANDDIQGTVTDANGNAVGGAVVALWKQDNPSIVKTTTADSNGNYIFENHPDNDGTSTNWHVAARDPTDATRQFPSLHSVSAQFPEPLPDSPTAQYQYDAQLLDGFTGGETVSSWTDQRVSSVTINGQGTYRPSAINGYAAVDHDGVDDGFDSNETTLGLPVALIAVVDTSSLPSSEEDIIAPAGDNSDRLKLGASNGAWFAFGGGSVIQGSTDSSIQLVSCLSTGNDELFLREEGTQTASTINSDETEGVEAVSVGYEAANNRRSWTGSIGFAEIHQNITHSELATREQEIADYWDITL